MWAKDVFLRRWPRPYATARETYHGFLRLSETWLLGTWLHEWRWRSAAPLAAAEFEQQVAHPHRHFLVDRLMRRMPLERMLEVGCHTGQNLMLLGRQMPTVQFTGVDINPRFVATGRTWCARDGLDNVRLDVAAADDLRRFGEREFDLTFTDATLIYLGPDKIERALQEIVRVTRRAVLFNEWGLDHAESGETSRWYGRHWVHNYRSLMRPYARDAEIRVVPVPPGLWAPGGGWERYGCLVEVQLTER